MKRKLLKFGQGFRVALGNRRSQAAQMVLAPGDSEGGPDNRHKGSDQWLFVVSGTGAARVNGKGVPLQARTLLQIDYGDVHDITNTGRAPLRTVNFYVPPAYTRSGEPLPRGRARQAVADLCARQDPRGEKRLPPSAWVLCSETRRTRIADRSA